MGGAEGRGLGPPGPTSAVWLDVPGRSRHRGATSSPAAAGSYRAVTAHHVRSGVVQVPARSCPATVMCKVEVRNRAQVISRARTHGLLRPPVPACPDRGGHGPPGRTSTVSLGMSGPIAVLRGSLAS